MPSIVERAFEIAHECSSLTELKKRLQREGFEDIATHLGGLGTQRQLRALLQKPRDGERIRPVSER